MKGPWLERFTWPIIVETNRQLCEPKGALHKPTSDGYSLPRLGNPYAELLILADEQLEAADAHHVIPEPPANPERKRSESQNSDH